MKRVKVVSDTDWASEDYKDPREARKRARVRLNYINWKGNITDLGFKSITERYSAAWLEKGGEDLYLYDEFGGVLTIYRGVTCDDSEILEAGKQSDEAVIDVLSENSVSSDILENLELSILAEAL